MVSVRFQVLFHSGFPVLFTFPSRYYALSVTREYLALPRGRGSFTWDSTCPMILRSQGQKVPSDFVYAAITRYGRPFQSRSTISGICNSPRTPNDPPP